MSALPLFPNLGRRYISPTSARLSRRWPGHGARMSQPGEPTAWELELLRVALPPSSHGSPRWWAKNQVWLKHYGIGSPEQRAWLERLRSAVRSDESGTPTT